MHTRFCGSRGQFSDERFCACETKGSLWKWIQCLTSSVLVSCDSPLRQQSWHTLTCLGCLLFAWRCGSRFHLVVSPSPSLTENNTKNQPTSEVCCGRRHYWACRGERKISDQQNIAQAVGLMNLFLRRHVAHELHDVCRGNRETREVLEIWVTEMTVWEFKGSGTHSRRTERTNYSVQHHCRGWGTP